MKKLVLLILTAFALAACTSTDYSANVTGVSNNVMVVVKDFVTLGIVTVQSTEMHHSSPFGIKKSIQGSKITYADLMQEAAKLEADEIINIRIDVNADYSETLFDWITGWSRVYTYTGTALAIKYTDKLDSGSVGPNLGSLPKAPEATSAVKKPRKQR